jgi:hypothetical protein
VRGRRSARRGARSDVAHRPSAATTQAPPARNPKGRGLLRRLAGGMAFRLTDNTTLNGSIGVGVNRGDVGGRVGLTFAW